MLRYLSILFFFISIKCVANSPVNCSNINDSTPKMAANILNYMCSYNKLNKMNYISENTNVLNDWIAKGFFFIIDQTENAVLIPYEIFKKLIYLSYPGYVTEDLLDDSSVISVAEASKIHEISNTSCLIKIPLNSLNNFLGINDDYRRYYSAFSAENFFIALSVVVVVVVFAGILFLIRYKCQQSSKKKTYNNIPISSYNIPMTIKECYTNEKTI